MTQGTLDLRRPATGAECRAASRGASVGAEARVENPPAPANLPRIAEPHQGNPEAPALRVAWRCLRMQIQGAPGRAGVR